MVCLFFLWTGIRTAPAEEMELPPIEVQGRGATLLFSGPTHERAVALTFDDGPHPTKTPLLLDLLRKKQVLATFFLLGEKVVRYPSVVAHMAKEGHEIGNHTYSHANLKKLGPARVRSELEKTQSAILEASGVRPRFFRPPYGATDLTTMATLANLGLSAVYWSVDTQDWKGRSAESILHGVLENLRPGAILLFHDHGDHTLEAVARVIDAVRNRGYEFRTVSELFNLGERLEPIVMAAASKPPNPPPPDLEKQTARSSFAARPLPTPKRAPSLPVGVESPAEQNLAVSSASRLPRPEDFPPADPLRVDRGPSPPRSPDSGNKPFHAGLENRSGEETVSSPDRSPQPSATPLRTKEALPAVFSEPMTSTEPVTKPPTPTPHTFLPDPPTSTPVPTSTHTPTPIPSWTSTQTYTPSKTPSPTLPPTETPTATPSPTASHTPRPLIAARPRPRKVRRLVPLERFSRRIPMEPRSVEPIPVPFQTGSPYEMDAWSYSREIPLPPPPR